ncbi:hypothetical protein ES703_36171 [subsurface metagenome]
MNRKTYAHLLTRTIIVVLLSIPYSMCLAIDSDSTTFELKLPSFSIFQASRMWPVLEPEEPLDLQKLSGISEGIISVTKGVEESMDMEPMRDMKYFIIPLIFYKTRHLYSKTEWSPEEVKLGSNVSSFLADYVQNPNLRITGSNQHSFREGLEKLANWFSSLCKDNEILASMIFTFDDGPFYGADVSIVNLVDLESVDSIVLPRTNNRLFLKRIEGKNEPMIISLADSNNEIVWQKILTASPRGKIRSAKFFEKPVVEIEEYGHKVRLLVDWDYGKECCHMYLDESGNMRFYFVSW